MTLFYETIGRGQPIVLIHGWGFDARSMLPLAEKLAPHYQVTYVDLPGIYRSEMLLSDNSLAALVNLLVPIIPPKAIILGWSLGGLVALQLAAKIPDVKQLILLMATPCFVAQPDWPGTSPISFSDFLQLANNNMTQALQQFFYLQACAYAKPRAILPQLLSYATPLTASSQSALLSWLALLGNIDLRSYLTELTCPILAIYAKTDPVINFATATTINSFNPTIKVISLADSCHTALITEPNLLADIIYDNCTN